MIFSCRPGGGWEVVTIDSSYGTTTAICGAPAPTALRGGHGGPRIIRRGGRGHQSVVSMPDRPRRLVQGVQVRGRELGLVRDRHQRPANMWTFWVPRLHGRLQGLRLPRLGGLLTPRS